MDCCKVKTGRGNKTRQKMSCPNCQRISKSVSNTTVLQQLSFPLNLELATDDYFYCANSDCHISYFSAVGARYDNTDLRATIERNQTLLCYCFDISKQRYLHALEHGTGSDIKNFVIEKTKLNQCACEIRNPSGLCCLADFSKMENQK